MNEAFIHMLVINILQNVNKIRALMKKLKFKQILLKT